MIFANINQNKSNLQQYLNKNIVLTSPGLGAGRSCWFCKNLTNAGEVEINTLQNILSGTTIKSGGVL